MQSYILLCIGCFSVVHTPGSQTFCLLWFYYKTMGNAAVLDLMKQREESKCTALLLRLLRETEEVKFKLLLGVGGNFSELHGTGKGSLLG